MALTWYGFEVRSSGQLASGLTPIFLHLKRLVDNGDVTPQPTITAIGNGQYKFQYDAEAMGEASAVIDAGTTITADAERYFGLVLAVDSSRIQSGIDANGKMHARQVDDKTGYILDPLGLAPIQIEPGVDPVLALRQIGSATAGVSDGAGTGTMHYYAMMNPQVLRITADVTLGGNRTRVTFN